MQRAADRTATAAGVGAGAGTHSQTQEVGEARTWLVRHPTEWRQVGIVALYQSLLMAMMFVPAARHPLVLIPAGMLSFLNAVVIHNHLHRGIFHSHRLNMISVSYTHLTLPTSDLV